MPPVTAAVASGGLWISPTPLLAVIHLPLAIVQWNAQIVFAMASIASAAVLFPRHDRVELGWTR
jgi:hypothetical protein